MIYLDTHVVLWLYLRKGEGLSKHARQLIEYNLRPLNSHFSHYFVRNGLLT